MEKEKESRWERNYTFGKWCKVGSSGAGDKILVFTLLNWAIIVVIADAIIKTDIYFITGYSSLRNVYVKFCT